MAPQNLIRANGEAKGAWTARGIADELELALLSWTGVIKSARLCASVRLESSAAAAVARLELEMAGFVSELQPDSGCRALSMNSQAQQPSDARDELSLFETPTTPKTQGIAPRRSRYTFPCSCLKIP